MEIGDKLKRLRLQKDLTQEELALRCELSKGFISQIERDQASPSIATLVDILESLGTNLRDFFSDAVPEKLVFKKDDFFICEDGETGAVIQWIIPNAQKNMMEPILITLKPKGRSEKLKPYMGEVFGFVLKGGVTLNLGGAKHKAKAGESFYYKASAEHYIENVSKEKAEVLWISAPPNF